MLKFSLPHFHIKLVVFFKILIKTQQHISADMLLIYTQYIYPNLNVQCDFARFISASNFL